MKKKFCSFLVFGRKIKTVVINAGDNGIDINYSETFSEIEKNNDTQEKLIKTARKVLNLKNENISSGNMSLLNLPEQLLTALVAGITREGSLQAAFKIAGSMLFDVKRSFIISDINLIPDLSDIDAIVISGGFDELENTWVDDFVLKLASDDSLKNKSPLVVYAGCAASLPSAKSNIGSITRLISVPNALEIKSLSGVVVSNEFFSQHNTTSWNVSAERFKLPEISFTDALEKIAGVFHKKQSERSLALLFTDNYFVINECSGNSGNICHKRHGVACKSSLLRPCDMTESLKSAYLNDHEIFNVDFTEEDLFRVNRENEEIFYRPGFVSAISLSGETSVERFLDLFVDPDVVRGIIEFIFDGNGFLLSMAAMMSDNESENSMLASDIFGMECFTTGWIVVPDGEFVKDRQCLTVYVSGNEDRNEMMFNWGKRYIINVEPYSVIEIDTEKGVFFKGEKTRKILKIGKLRRTVVFDLRKEKS